MLRLILLWCLLTGLTLIGAMLATPTESLILLAANQLGDAAVQIGAGGKAALYRAMVGQHFDQMSVFVTAGGIAGLCTAAAVKVLELRSRPSAATKGQDTVLTDRFGGALVMKGLHLDYESIEPVFSRAEAEIEGLEDGKITEFERDALRLLAAREDMPADVSGHHGVSLLEHTVAAWEKVVRTAGAGSLPALLTISHDLGKVACYEKQDGVWVKKSNRHEQLSLVVARALPGFAKLDPTMRAELALGLSMLVSKQKPLIVADHIRDAVYQARAADTQTTSAEKQHGEVEIDVPTLVAEWEAYKPAIFRGMNINRALRPADPIEGIYKIGTPHLVFVNEVALRKRIAMHFSRNIVQAMRLDSERGSSIHPALPMIMRALADSGDLLREYETTQSDNGFFAVRSAKVNFKYMLCLDISGIADAVKQVWGNWSQEIDVSPNRQVEFWLDQPAEKS